MFQAQQFVFLFFAYAFFYILKCDFNLIILIYIQRKKTRVTVVPLLFFYLKKLIT